MVNKYTYASGFAQLTSGDGSNHATNCATITTNLYLFILSDGDVLFDAEGPVDVQRVLVEGEHEDDEHEEGVEHREEEDGLVAQLLQLGLDFGLK